MKKKIIIAVSNDLVTDQRVHKVATSLQNEIGDVTLVGRRFKNSAELYRNYKTTRFSLFFNKKVLFYTEYNIRLFFYLIFKRVDVIVSNDLDTLPACYFAAKFKLAKLVYDSHEYFTEVPELINRNCVRKFWLKIEELILPRVKNCYTVCQSIADIYNKKYSIDMKVVRNVPFTLNSSNIIIKNEPKIVVYQGAINVGRGIEEAILAMQFVDNAELLIFGSGDIEDEISNLVIENNLQNKVKIKGRLSFEKLHDETPKASLGLCIEKGKEQGLSYYYALPNKLFDYIHAGVPVLLNDLPEKKRILDEFEIGYIMEDYSPLKLGEQITSILKSDQTMLEDNLQKASKVLCWENEQNILLDIYKSLV